MINYKQQEYLLLKSLCRAVKRANYWTETIARATNKKQVELWSKIEDEAYGHVENCIYMLDWLEEKIPKEIESDLPIIIVEPKVTRTLVPKSFHRSWGGLLLPDEEIRE